jgi:hypothetical protein
MHIAASRSVSSDGFNTISSVSSMNRSSDWGRVARLLPGRRTALKYLHSASERDFVLARKRCQNAILGCQHNGSSW